jgi:predicted DNA-binding protein YlxM (UPF0122 family)
MKEKDFSVCLLYDIYSPLLSEKKRTVFELSYWEDMSLSEIAEHTGTTRQGVRELLSRTLDDLHTFEEALKLKEKQEKLIRLSEELRGTYPEISDKLKEMI